jgi:hypothetical protein
MSVEGMECAEAEPVALNMIKFTQGTGGTRQTNILII